MDIKSKIILISGPTASGKSNFAIKVAKKVNGEIINADSMQVYKKIKILTARPNKEEQKNIKHHLYGVIDLNKNFSTGQWLKLTINLINNIRKRKKVPILVGGTGLYFQSLIDGLVKIPEIPLNFRNKIRSKQKKEGQKKFYKNLLKLDPKVSNKIDSNDIQRSIRAFEVKSFTKISMYDWLEKTEPEFEDKEFLRIYIDYKREDLIKKIRRRKKVPILVGGTGLYFQSLINGLVKIPEIPFNFRNKIRAKQKKEGQKKFYKNLLKLDPKILGKIDPNDTQRSIRAFEVRSFTKISMYDWLDKTRPEFKDNEFLKIYIDYKREDLIKEISLRTKKMIKDGALNEVKKFLKLKIKKDKSINKVIGIDELTQYLNKKINLEEAEELIFIKTRQYAKRQATWARSRMMSWEKISSVKFENYIKRLNKSSLKLDQLT